jgi:hypothetical protein
MKEKKTIRRPVMPEQGCIMENKILENTLPLGWADNVLSLYGEKFQKRNKKKGKYLKEKR